jgi:hypothetical protein
MWRVEALPLLAARVEHILTTAKQFDNSPSHIHPTSLSQSNFMFWPRPGVYFGAIFKAADKAKKTCIRPPANRYVWVISAYTHRRMRLTSLYVVPVWVNSLEVYST